MKKVLLFIFIFVLGFLLGDFESRDIKKKIENVKIKYFSNKNLELDKNDTSVEKIKIKANSYEVIVEELLSLELSSNDQPEYVLRTAGFQINKLKDKYKYRLFFQNGIFVDEKKLIKLIYQKQPFMLIGVMKKIFFTEG
jgi:hypothetical protein